MDLENSILDDIKTKHPIYYGWGERGGPRIKTDGRNPDAMAEREVERHKNTDLYRKTSVSLRNRRTHRNLWIYGNQLRRPEVPKLCDVPPGERSFSSGGGG
jgi:hypothetical protein